MPELEHAKKKTATEVATRPADGATSPTARESLRTRAGQTSFAEGEALLRPDRAPVPTADGTTTADAEAEAKKKEEERVAAARRSYEQALGKFLGGKLFDLIHAELSPDKLLGHGKDGVKALGAVTKSIEPTAEGAAGGIMDEADEAAAAKALADALVAWAQGEAVKWLEGENGQAVLEKINHWVEGHPKTVALSLVAAALAAATYAWVSNMSIPEIDQEFELGEKWKAKLGADLGKVQDLALKAAEVGISYHAGGLTVGASGTYERTDGGDVYGVSGRAALERDDHTADLSGSYRTDGSQKYGAGYRFEGKAVTLGTRADATVDAEGNLVVAGKGNFAKGKLSAEAATSRSSNAAGDVTAQKTTATVAYGDERDRHTVDGVYDHVADEFTLSTGRLRLFEGEGYRLKLNEGYTPEGKTTDIRATATPTRATTLSMGVNATGDRVDGANVGVKYTKDWLKAQLDLEMKAGKSSLTASTEVNRGDFSATGSTTVNLDDGRVTALALKFGWKDPDAFRSFLAEYKRQWVEDNRSYADQFDLMLEQSLGKVQLRVQGRANLEGGQVTGASAKALAAYPLNDDLKLLGGVGYDYQAGGANNDLGLNRGSGATVYGGVQFKGVPVTVGYRPEDRAWTLGIQLRF